MTELDLDAIRARANAATDGPWERYGDGSHEVYCAANFEDTAYEPPDVTYGSDRPADAEFIAHARTDVPALVETIREMQDREKLFRDVIDGKKAEVERLRSVNDFLLGELQADDDLRHGNYRDFDDIDELIAHLKDDSNE